MSSDLMNGARSDLMVAIGDDCGYREGVWSYPGH